MKRKEFWNEFFEEDAKVCEHKPFLYDLEYKLDMAITTAVINSKQNKSLLEIGCGDGNFLEYLKENGYNDLWGLDTNVERLDRVPKNVANLININIEDYDWDRAQRKFSTIVFRHSLEHMPDYFIALVHALELLEDDGILVINFYDWSKKSELVPSMIHMFDKERLKATLEYIGFEYLGFQDSSQHYTIVRAWKHGSKKKSIKSC